MLVLSGKAFTLVEDDNLLYRGVFMLFSLGNGCEKVRASTFFEDALGRLTLRIQLPVFLGTLIGGVKNRVIEEWVGRANGKTSLLLLVVYYDTPR